jgi:hypothetical protein
MGIYGANCDFRESGFNEPPFLVGQNWLSLRKILMAGDEQR